MRTLGHAEAAANFVPPPDYEGVAGMYRGYRPRIAGSGGGSGGGGESGGGNGGGSGLPSQVRETGVQRVDARRWRDLTGVRVRR